MSYDDAHGYTLVYGQQQYVNSQASIFVSHVNAAPRRSRSILMSPPSPRPKSTR
ncbi:MAG TPA: hypothetical protein VNW54_14210 [Granulicella sp.]|nr:hypothetical protein [Granulicella sp.]